MKQSSMLSGLVVIVAGILTGLFSLNLVVGIGNAMNNVGLSLLVVCLFVALFLGVWHGICSFVVKRSKIALDVVRKKQSIAFLSFFVLGLFPVTSFVAIPSNFASFSSLPSLLLLMVALSLYVLLALLLLDVEIKSKKIPMKFVYCAAALFFVVVTLLASLKHHSFYSTAFDLGLYNQVMHGYAQGSVFSSILSFSILADHVQPILFLLTPVYWLFSSPLTLIVIQSLAIAIGSIPLFLLGRKYLKHEIAAFALFVGYFFVPALWYPALFDFHPLTLAVPFLMYAVYFLVEKRYGLMVLFLVLAGLCKENLALLLVPFGIYLFLKDKKRVFGAVLAVIGAVWLYVNLEVVIPYFIERFPRGISFDVFNYYNDTPLDTIKHLFSVDTIGLLGLLFMEYGFGVLSLFGLPILLLGTTEFGILVARQGSSLADIVYHHQVSSIVFVILSALFGIVVLNKWLPKLKLKYVVRKNIVPALAFFALATSVLSFSFYGPFALLYDVSDFNPSSPYVENGMSIISLVPEDASVAAANWVIPHLSGREHAYRLKDVVNRPEFTGFPEYIVLDLGEAVEDAKRSANLISREQYSFLVSSERYGVVAVEGNWVLLEQGADHEGGLCDLAEVSTEYLPDEYLKGIFANC